MQERFSLKIEKLPREGVLRSLGYKDQDLNEALDAQIEDLLAETLELAEIRAAFRTGALERENGLSLLGLDLQGEAIADHLNGSDKAGLFAVTLGSPIESRLKRYSLTELDKALIMDAAASVLVEEACDKVSAMFEEEMAQKGLYTTERFSPGYADLPLELQPQILSRLDAPRKIGLNANEHNLLIPRKSVTAIIGVRDTPRPYKSDRCQHCIRRDKCKFGLCYFER